MSMQLIAPGGSYEKALIALECGADSVYVGGHHFGLRKSADNLSKHQLKRLIHRANALNKHIYITLNSFAHDEDIDQLATFINDLNELQPHALIVSDFGVFQTCRSESDISIHVSTQASVSNTETARFWKYGAKRVVVSVNSALRNAKPFKKVSELKWNIRSWCDVCQLFWKVPIQLYGGP